MKVSKKTLFDTEIESTFAEMFSRIKSEFQIASFSVYEYRRDIKTISHTFGEKLDNVTLDKYFSFENSAGLTNADGFYDNTDYKSRFVSRFSIGKTDYLVIFSSYGFETFRGATPRYIIESIGATKRRVGIIHDGLCPR